jgi:hypothetical protein
MYSPGVKPKAPLRQQKPGYAHGQPLPHVDWK